MINRKIEGEGIGEGNIKVEERGRERMVETEGGGVDMRKKAQEEEMQENFKKKYRRKNERKMHKPRN